MDQISSLNHYSITGSSIKKMTLSSQGRIIWQGFTFSKIHIIIPLMKPIWILALFILSLILIYLTGCETIWKCGNNWTLKKDIVELFKKHGVVIADPVCNMIGTTRNATCEFSASAAQVSSLVKGLNLKEVQGEGESKDHLLLKSIPSNGGCLACGSFKNASKIKVYFSGRWPSELQLKRGTAFKYLILFQDLETDKACVQVFYAYG